MTLKNVALAFAAVFALSAAAAAGDLVDDLAGMDLASINESAASVEEFDLAAVDVEGLEEEAGSDDETDAVEACYRRFGGHSHGGWNNWGGYCNYGYQSFNHCYSYCSPTYYCYRPIVTSCYTHCYSHCYPVVTSYWGCY